VSMTHTELKHPTDISNTSCGTVVGFIPTLKREAFSSILCNTRTQEEYERTPLPDFCLLYA